MGNQRALADSTSIDTTPVDPNSSVPTRRNLSGVTTTRPSYSFTRAGSSKSTPPASRSASRSSSLKKRTVKTTANKSTSQELASQSHKKAHVEAISKSAPFRSKTSLTPRSAELLNSFNNTPTSPIHALNFSAATPSQTSTTLSSVHVTGEFKASNKPTNTQPHTAHITDSSTRTISPPPTTGRPIGPIIEVEMEGEKTSRLGMESGFDSSPMAKLIREYSGEADDLEVSSIPTQVNVGLVLDMSELSEEMVVDRGLVRDKGLPRYQLDALNLDRITTVVTEQQIFLERAAGLITERTNYFKIDPGDTLLPILKGTSSLAQLRAAWLALRHRIELGTKAWKKYITEYQLPPDSKPSLSPLSTLPELYQPLQDIADRDEKLRYLYERIPHHNEQLTQEGRHSLESTRSWLDILPVPDALKNAFLDDTNEPPPTTTVKETKKVSKGKEREHQRSSKPDARSSVWMGMETPFKSANAWFVDPGKSNRAKQPGASKPPAEPNILLGIATPLAPQTVKGWEAREQPPHMTGQQQEPEGSRKSGRAESQVSSRRNARGDHSRHRGRRDNDPDEPSSSDDDGDSSRTRRSHRSHSRRRRSRTPRPRRRRSSTPRPRRRRSPPDDDGGDSSGDGTSYYSSSGSTYSGSKRR